MSPSMVAPLVALAVLLALPKDLPALHGPSAQPRVDARAELLRAEPMLLRRVVKDDTLGKWVGVVADVAREVL